jgi:hypothetical protein
VGQAVGFVIALLVFAAIYAVIRGRSGGPVQWGWLVAIVACAGVAFVLSYVL